jgi:molybdopterin-guanine dinucleotide biosynthesis protein A
MGQPKALLPFGGQPLIIHIVRQLQEIAADIVVAAAPEQELPPLPATVVRDDVAYQGPVGGIYYGLKASVKEVSFVTSCDVAFLNLPLISHLISAIKEFDVVVPCWQQRFQPLHAVYRRSVLPHLRLQLERGELRPVFLYEKVRTLKVGEETIRGFDPEGLSFLNMNTPEDYRNALHQHQEIFNSSFTCTVELFSVARLLAKTRTISLALPNEATLADVLSALAEKLPVLVGPVISPDRGSLASGNACNINGKDFVRDSSAKVRPGDSIFLLSADAGG